MDQTVIAEFGSSRPFTDRRQNTCRRQIKDRRKDHLLVDAERRRLGDRRSGLDRRSSAGKQDEQ